MHERLFPNKGMKDFSQIIYVKHTHTHTQRMFVPICICALDPALYRNVNHSRFILGLHIFFVLMNLKMILFFSTFPIRFQCGVNLTPRTLNQGPTFFTHLQNNQIRSSLCVCVYVFYVNYLRKVFHALIWEKSFMHNFMPLRWRELFKKIKGNFYLGHPDPRTD